MKFRETKTGLPICPYFLWQSESHREDDSDESISICFCNHPENPSECEGNCEKEICPLLKGAKE